MSEVPPHVTGLAEQRAKARTNRDYAGADALRDEIEAEGWLVRDAGDGFELIPKPPFEVWPTVSSVPVPGAGGRGGSPESDTEPGSEAGAGSEPAGRDATAMDTGRVAEVADPPARPERLGHLDAERVAETEAAPKQKPEGSELVGRSDENEGDPERMVSSQLLWDGSLSVSRLDEALSPVEHEEPAAPLTVTVGLVVDGWPDDLRKCVRALVARTEAKIIGLDLGNVDGAGAVLEELAEEFPRRVEAWHVAETPHWRGGSAGWGESRTKLLKLDTSDVHVVMETSTILDGDAITPLVRALTDDVAAAGWRGVNPGADGHEWHDAEPGEVRGLLGHLFAVRRDAALAAGAFPEGARYYRNADLEFSLTLPGTLVALGGDLPVHQERHRGYHDVDPGYRERESRRTYERVLRLLRDT
ncbi:CysS/YqeB C-terminal domain-containing protein [Streptosporangium sp. CA-135522]|uniref:CysS/YqeB C-terminal domain-containing protein n=1 Tax=Streptosporangium sp. CA-135522 TaxID=3240072 RepID=UPI003D89F080